MIKRAVVLFLVRVALWPVLLFVFSSVVRAAPAISGATVGGGVISISGSGFGAKPVANPLVWDTFENGTVGAQVLANNAIIGKWDTGAGYDQLFYSNAQQYSGSKSAKGTFLSSVWDVSLSKNGTFPIIYLDYWTRIHPYDNRSRNWKAWRFYGDNDNLQMTGVAFCDGSFTLHIVTAGLGEQVSWGSYAYQADRWHHFQIFYKESDVNTANGMMLQYIDGVLANSFYNAVTRTNNASIDQIRIGHYWATDAVPGCDLTNSGADIYMDNVYIDTTLAHVEIGNASTYTASSVRQVQLPGAWSDTALSVSANTDSFVVGQTVYLYVFDASGTSNAVGYPIILGAADTTAPTIPTLFGVESPNTSSIALSWIKGTDAIGPVTTDIERCTGWGCTTYTSLTNTAASTYTDTGLTSAQIYRYRIRSRDGAGNVSAYVETYFNPRPIIPAFPGAEGAGAASIGGRGGAICRVTNLNDSGAGSLRACTTAQGPRTVVFTVGGTINLQSVLPINNPYITIAGQTAPGGGITVSAKSGYFDAIGMNTHNIIIRYIRFARGYYANYPQETGDTVSIFGPANNIIFDHITARWANDGNIDIWRDNINEKTNNITVGYSIVSEPLGDQKNINFGANGNASETIVNVDMHHNFIYGYARNPLTTVKSFRFVNNIDYNFVWEGLNTGGGAWVDVINNRFKAGPAFNPARLPVRVFPLGGLTTPLGSPSIYVAGNIGPLIMDPLADNWPIVANADGPGTGQNGYLNSQYRRTTALPALQFPITAEPGAQLELTLLPHVGSSRRLDCVGDWVSNRDAVDIRVLNNYTADTGVFPTDEATVGGLPILDAGTPCTDTDSDGMPDSWEIVQGLNPNSSTDALTIHASGYTNLERYLSGNSTKPLLSSIFPASRHPANTATTSLQVTTSVNANCRYSTVAAAVFTVMIPFSVTGGVSHTSTVSVSSGEVYRYYIRCQSIAMGDLSDLEETRFYVDPIPRRQYLKRGRR